MGGLGVVGEEGSRGKIETERSKEETWREGKDGEGAQGRMWTREGEDRKGHKKAAVSRRKMNGLREGEREGPLGLGRKHEVRGGRMEGER
mmetsp:Transcript_22978/g.54451  ORF Transcript_22978/g.54451 Transcript_22978/m.54451 type:complete len:90 (+) Transcript_22978:525-794(+)